MPFLSLWKELKTNRLMRGSFILFCGSMIFNLGNYFFNVLVARSLTPDDYGIFMALLSIVVILSVPTTTVQTIFTRFIARLKGKKDFAGMRHLFNIGTRLLLIVGALMTMIVYLISPYLGNFLFVPQKLIAILSLIFLVSFILPINRGILAGNSLFTSLSINIVSESLIKIGLCLIVLHYGFGLSGLMLILTIAYVMVYLLTFPFIWKIFQVNQKDVKLNRGEIYRYSSGAFLTFLFIVIIFNLDMIFAKHFFSPFVAGQYAALATLGKIVFYITGPIGIVLLPIVAEKQVKGEQYQYIFRQALGLTLGIALIITLIYYLMPNLIIKILFGEKYLFLAKYLYLYGIVMILYSIMNIFVSYYLSIHRNFFIWLIGAATIALVVLMSFWHHGVLQLILTYLGIMVMLTVSLVMVYWIENRHKVIQGEPK